MKRKTHKKFVEQMNDVNSDIEIIGKYINNKTKIKCKCKLCNMFWDAIPNNILSGSGCPYCYNKTIKTHEDFIWEIKKINPNIKIISQYVNAKSNVTCKCKVDGYIWNATPDKLIHKRGCPKCAGVAKKTTKQFIDDVKVINSNVRILSEYKNDKTKVHCECLICGHTWYITPNCLLNGWGCPLCNESKGENKIMLFLKNHNILFETQKRFKNLIGVGNGLLSYDFYLPKFNTLIEYQGIQHIKPIDFNGIGNEYANNAFKKQEEHDERKRKFALDNNYKLLEIWYNNFENINDILEKYLVIREP